MRIRLAELASPTITRSRGKEAYENLKALLVSGQQVQIEVTDDTAVSMSFLDELVHRVATSGRLSQVTFVCASQETIRKLARISGIREIDLHHAASDGARRKIPRRATRRPGHVITGVKSPSTATG